MSVPRLLFSQLLTNWSKANLLGSNTVNLVQFKVEASGDSPFAFMGPVDHVVFIVEVEPDDPPPLALRQHRFCSLSVLVDDWATTTLVHGDLIEHQSHPNVTDLGVLDGLPILLLGV